MNDQPVPSSILPPSAPRKSPTMLILVVVLGLGAALFATLAIVSFGQAHRAKADANATKLAAATAARTDQEAKDTIAARQSNESPFRSYLAPNEYGGFEIKFPKNWSSSIDEEASSTTQVALLINPDFIRRVNGTEGLMAARVTLSQRNLDANIKLYASQKPLSQSTVSVSGIRSTQFSGTFNDKRTQRIVLVPVRDKTIIFANEDKNYAREFDAILAQSKIVP